MTHKPNNMPRNRRCQLCKRYTRGIAYWAFIPTEGLHIGIPTGKNYILCVECAFSHIAQKGKLPNKQIEEFGILMGLKGDFDDDT